MWPEHWPHAHAPQVCDVKGPTLMECDIKGPAVMACDVKGPALVMLHPRHNSMGYKVEHTVEVEWRTEILAHNGT